MKKLYFVGLALIASAVGAMITYGAYLNESGEKQILQHMEYQTVRLKGDKVKYRSFRPIFRLNKVEFMSDETANSEQLKFSMLLKDAQTRKLPIGEHFELNFRYSIGEQIFLVHSKEILPDLSQAAAMRKIVFEVDNDVGILKEQEYSGGTLTGTTYYKALTIPLLAMEEDRKYVFVLERNNVLSRRAVLSGSDDGKYIEILSGLQEGEVVITDSTRRLIDGMKVTLIMTEVEN